MADQTSVFSAPPARFAQLIFGFVSLDTIPLDPHFRAARQSGAIEVVEYDEGMLQWALYAAGLKLPFLPLGPASVQMS